MINKRVIPFLIFLLTLASSSAFGALSTKNQAPGFFLIKNWMGNPPANPQGKVALITFWSPSNSKSLWELKIFARWYERYKASAPFEIIAVAVPEFQFEKDSSRVEPLISRLKLPFPVALDTEQKLWREYGITTVPTHVLVDAKGNVRNKYVGAIEYRSLENDLQTLLREASPELPAIDKSNIPELRNNPPMLFGYKKLSGYGGNEKMLAERNTPFTYPENIEISRFYLSGNWIPGEESLKSAPPISSIKIHFNASTISLVAGTEKRSLIPAEVRVDGNPILKENKGKDIVIQEGKSYVFIKEYRLYKLFKNKKESAQHNFEIIFEEPGIEIFKAGFE